MKNERGYTLLELSVVLLLAGILTAASATYYAGRNYESKRRLAKSCVMTAALADQRERTPYVVATTFAWPRCTLQLSAWYKFTRAMGVDGYELTAIPVDSVIARKPCYNFKVYADGSIVEYPLTSKDCSPD